MSDLSSPPRRFSSFAEFWPFYVTVHRSGACRFLHYAGGLAALGAMACAILTQSWWCLVLAPLFGYGCAWSGHFLFERNHPATFEYPLYSLRAEFKMLVLGLAGRMPSEVRRHCRDS